MRTVLITLIGPERTSDLVVDADTPVAELLPSLLAAGGVSGAAADAWSVALTGKQPVQPDRTLEQSGVLDGAVLVLRRQAAAPAEPVLGSLPGSATWRSEVAVAGTWAVDKGVSWVWDHGGSHVAGEAWDGINDAGSWISHESAQVVKTAKHVIHDLEPWHW